MEKKRNEIFTEDKSTWNCSESLQLKKKCVCSGTHCIIHFGRIELSTLKFKNRQERLARHDKYAALPLRHLQPRRGRPICAWISWTSASHAREGRTRKKKKKREKRPGINGNWENREKPGWGSKFHESLKFWEREKKRHCNFARVAENRLIGSSVLKRGRSMSTTLRMTSYKFSECNIVDCATSVVLIGKCLL